MTLTARQQQVLRIIVDEYVHAPVPVPSESVTQKMPVRVSSATVRNDIAALENDGYIIRPHTSAGGVPSDKAYRAYVEFLGDALEPSGRVKQLIRRNVKNASLDIESQGKSAVRLLSELVHAMAIFTVPTARAPRWKHLDIVHIHGLLALLILVLQGSLKARQQHILLKEPLSQDELTAISNKLNARYAGLAHGEVSAKNLEFAEHERGIAVTAAHMLKTDEGGSVPDHFVDGLRHIFTYPELSEGTRARAIAELLEYQSLVRLLMDEMPEVGMVRVNIGAENKEDILRPFTVVFARYDSHDDGSGLVGVLGPTRFEYASAISSVRYLASVMNDVAEAS